MNTLMTVHPDYIPAEIALPIALALTVGYFLLRHRQNKKADQ